MSGVSINDELLYPFAVAIAADDSGPATFLGSGFVAAPGFVVTCAHVVAGIADGASVHVTSALPQVHGARAVVRARSPRRPGADRTWGWPDLAIVELLDPDGDRLTEHPCPRVDLDAAGPQQPTRHRAVVAVRLKPSDAASVPHLRGVDFVWESVDDHGLWWLAAGHAQPGMSGGMLLDPGRRAIVAVVNNSRNTAADVGAMATPLTALRATERFDDAMGAAATELVRAVRQAPARTHDSWDGAFSLRARFAWRDCWSPDVADGDGFVGRHRDLDRLATALDTAEGLAVVRSIGGFGGVGKTALAVAFGDRFRGRFPDGRVFHDFRSYRGGRADTAADALGSVLTAIGAVDVDEVSRLSLRERQDRWRAAAAGRRLLMVWDNVGSPEQLDGLLIRDEGCATIVTSRDTVLGGGSRHLDLDVLTETDAVAMFAELAGDDHPPELVAELVRRDLCVPVLIRTHAIEIADAHSTLAEIVSDLPEPSALRHRSDPDRHKDLFDRLDGSYRRLEPETRTAFRALGAHPGYRATIGSLAAAMGCPPREAQRRLAALVAAGLATRDLTGGGVERELRTYRAHDLIRAYGAHLAEGEPAPEAAGTERDLVHARLTDYYFDRLGGRTASNGHRWFSIEVDSIRDLVLAHDGERYGHLARYLGYRGNVFSHYDAAEAGFAHARRIDERRGDVERTAHCVWGLGEVARSRGQLDLARDRYDEALALSRRAGDNGGIGNAERGLGEIAQLRFDAEAAETHYRAAMTAYRTAGFPHRVIYLWRGLARVSELKGDFRQARRLFATALAQSRAEDDAVGVASAQRGLADVALAQGASAEAEAHYRACEAGFAEAGEPVSAARAVQGLGRVALARGDRVEARVHFERAEAVFEEYDAGFWLRRVRADLADLGDGRPG